MRYHDSNTESYLGIEKISELTRKYQKKKPPKTKKFGTEVLDESPGRGKKIIWTKMRHT